jgi:hypothetical protein
MDDLQFFRNFDWAIVDPTKPWTSANNGLIVHSGLFMSKSL